MSKKGKELFLSSSYVKSEGDLRNIVFIGVNDKNIVIVSKVADII